ncbi:Neurobeachin-like protein 2 [Heterocephalus glaber]|uniref:Neurobeachin-like protein 2 n=1 Tax=Heterocephalus glaber TaxID=10181 RepID=G5ANQ7_HETGA|nr:Neurobeachin-like protein 2 [Heterocephalus glaber]
MGSWERGPQRLTFQLPVLPRWLHPLCSAVTPVPPVSPSVPLHLSTPCPSPALCTPSPHPLQKDLGYLQQWLKAFVGTFEKSISLSSLEPRRPEEAGAEVPLLPLDALHVLAEQLDHRDLGQALLLLKLFIVLCRNLENVEAGWGQVLLPRVLSLLTGLVAELKGHPPPREDQGAQLESVALHALLLCEGLFDPYQTWRRQHSGEDISSKEKSKYKFPPAPLPRDFSAFFQDTLWDADRLPPVLLLRLIHLFGAVLAGGKENGQMAVSASSVQGLLGVVRDWGRRPAQDARLVPLALEALVGAVHVLHASRTPPRGPELRTLLEGYFRVLNADWPASPSSGPKEALVALRVSMLDAIPLMLACEDRPVLQATFLSNNCFEHLIRLIQNSKLYLQARAPPEGDSDLATRLLTEPDVQKVLDQDTDAIAVHVVRVLTCIMSGSPSAKEVFKERIGYLQLQEVLQSHGPPTHRLLQELLNMAVEGDHSMCPPPPIRNEQPVLVLMQWLPALPTAELRLFLAQRLRWLCDSCAASRATCVQAGLVGSLLETLNTGSGLGARCQEQLLALLQALGRVSLRPLELRRLLRPPSWLDLDGAEAERARHAGAVIRALSGMARHQGPTRALRYFDLTPSMAGIMVPPVQRWPGPGFSFHAWLCLHPTDPAPAPVPARPLQRKQLYSFLSSSGLGFEAFFTAAGTLVVAVCTRKEYLTMSLPEVSFADSAWHCVAIVHVPGRRPFSQNLLHVYKDGHLVKTAPLRCPCLSEPFSSCCIGSAGHRTTTTTLGLPEPPVPTALAHTYPSLTRSQSVPASTGLGWGSGLVTPLQEGSISSTLAGTQDMRWGSPTSLEGELGTVAIFHEAVQAAALRTLCALGPNEPAPFKPEGELHDLGVKLLLHYSPQACKNNICLDLSPSHTLDGRLTGHRVETWDVKDVVNCVGGMGALLPLLDRVAAQPQEAEAGPAEAHDLVGPELTSGHNTQGLLLPLGREQEEVGITSLPVPSFFSSSGLGFEAFFTAAGTLVVAVCTRKEYLTMSLPEVSFADSAWHCVAIVHVPGRRPFSQNLLHVYKDGHLVKTAPLRCPCLSEPFSSCCIGSAGHRTTTTTLGLPEPPVPTALAHTYPSLTRSQSVPASTGLGWGSGLVTPLQEGSISSTLAGTQDMRWGSPTSLEGELGTVAIFHEAVQAAALRTLCALGPNEPAPFKPEGELHDLGVKLLLHYSPQACKNNICLDLSPSHTLDGRLTGHRVETWDVKDVVNCVGGMGALLPLLDRVAAQPQEAEAGPAEAHDLVGPELTSGHNTQGLLLPLGRSSEERMEKNAVAAFLLMLRNFLQGHTGNQESLVQCQGPAIVGALLRKVPSWGMDMNVLMSAQLLIEQVASESRGPLLYLLYQHLLLNFHLWTLSDFAVRLGHIQYMSSIIREHRQKLRRKYGVQFILDSLRTHYGPQRERPLVVDDLRTVQTSLLGLAREFLVRSSSPEDLQVLLSFLAAMGDDSQVVGVLDLLLGLLQASSAQDFLAVSLLEPGNLEVLLALLVRPGSLPLLPDRVCKILLRLQQNEGLPERSRQRLRLRDSGFLGLAACLPEGTVSPQLCQGLYRLLLGADGLNISDLLAVVQLSLQTDLSVRLDICRQLFHLIYRQPDVVRLLARQAGWQDVLTRLYVLEAVAASGAPPLAPELPTSPEPGLPPSSTESPVDLSDVFLPSDSPGPDPDAFYQALSPFCTPFDLVLERASMGSGTTAVSGSSSGTLTPASQPGTPSPLDGPRPFPAAPGRHSSSLSNVLEDGSLPTVSGDNASNTSNPQQTPEEELCNLLTNVLFSVTWRGVEGSDEAAWRERGQVFSVLTQLGASATLVRPPDCIKRSLLEMMLESALADIKEAAPGALASLTQQVLWLLRLLQDFLCAEGHGNQELWSEKLFEGVCSLLDRLGAWPHLANSTAELREMAQVGLRLVLGYILLEDPQLHAQAYVKLHMLLQTAVPTGREEACYVLSKLEAALGRALLASQEEGAPEGAQPLAAATATASERCSWLVPLVRTLLDRAYEPLGLQWGLPSLPPTNGSPTFFEDFQAFCATPEWRQFIDKQVQPTMSQFEMDTYAKSHDLMSGFWNTCYDMLMSSGQRRQRERTHSRQAFQELVLEPAQRRARLEGLRYAAALKQQAAQHSVALLHWGALWRQLSSPCGAWALRDPPTPHWKLSSAETYSRMRLKLVPNHHFDPHLEASALRDNLGEVPLAPTEEASLPLAMTKEAKVSTRPTEQQEDELEEDELAGLETPMEAAELDEQREKLVLSAECQLVTVVAVVPGLLEVTTQHVYFYDGSAERVETEEGIGHDFRRPLAQLREVHLRRFNLRRSALELFFIDQSNYFLNFPCRGTGTAASSPSQAPRAQPRTPVPHTQVRNQVYSWLLRLRPPAQGYLSSRSPQEMLRASGLTQKWVQREISNFEYLMQLNTIAGRTYNDLSQYPVFPWVLQDYVSPTLDLSNPAVFRDLSKPIGVVNPKHAQLVREKYESFEDPAGTIDKFHYGTHYSNAAGVMHYLIRVEPFPSLHVQLQTWQARLESPADVKELIPEFFYFPDFLENQNGFDLGCLQLTNEKVGNVVLPPWASSPEDFIQQHRRALESEHVSAHLHEWIDLIFGYKQRGPAAEEALNVFYYCTYEGAVDLDHVADERERKALEGIISNFGQTPCQLLKEPHPPRLLAEEAAQRLARLDTNSPSLFQHLDQLKAFFAEVVSDGMPLVLALVPHQQPHSFITQGSPDLLVTVSANGLLGTHNWLPYDRNINNYFSFSKDPTIGNPKMQRLLSGPWVPGSGVSGQALAVAPDGKLLFSGGHWDGSLRVTALPRGKLLNQLSRHLDVVTCLALDTCGIYLISGSRDTTCMVWRLLQQGGLSAGLAPKPVQVLYGHEAAVSCVAISTELDMAVSGSEDGTVIIHTVRRGQFVAALRPPGAALPGPVSHLGLGPEGQIVVQSSTWERPGAQVTHALHLYSVNGKLRASLPLAEHPTALAVTEDFVLLGTAQCTLHILHLNKLLPAAPPLPMKVPIRSVALTKERSHVLVGLEDGKLIVVGAGQPSEVRSSQFARKLWRSSRRISQVSSGETEYNPCEAR